MTSVDHIAATKSTPDPVQVARHHAIELEQCALFVRTDCGEHLAKAMTDAAEFLRGDGARAMQAAMGVTAPAVRVEPRETDLDRDAGLESLGHLVTYTDGRREFFPQSDVLVLRQGRGSVAWVTDGASAADAIAALEAERDALRAEVDRKDAALAFYADISRYPAPLTGGMGDLWLDCGRTARAALSSTKEAADDQR